MKPAERQNRIADSIGRDGEASVETLSARFAVSPETIRRDLARLAERGLVRKVHGGARPPRLATEPTFAARMVANAEGKRRIAAKLARMVQPGETLFIDTGTTTLFCAEALAATPGLTVITNSVRIADVFGAGSGQATVHLLGGPYRPGNAETFGAEVEEQIARFHADRAVLTVAAFDARLGAMDADAAEARIGRAMAARADEVTIVADLSKLGRRAVHAVCPLAAVATLVTDGEPGAAFRSALAEAGVALR